MTMSQARIEASRNNGRKSLGPSSPGGKARSKINAIKHSLCAKTVVIEGEEQVRERTEAFIEEFGAEGDFALWVAGQAALASLRIERCQLMERGVRAKASIRAELCWGDDARLEAARLGQSIAKGGDSVVEKLRRTPQGCDWLIGRWALLAHAAEVKKGWTSKKGWTAEQTALAFDLLATPPEFREGLNPGASVDPSGRVLDSAEDPATLARRMVDELLARRDMLAEIDEARQALAEADLDDEVDPELKRVRRYEASLQRRLRWCLDQLANPSEPEGSTPSPRAKAEPAIPDAPPPEPMPMMVPEPQPEPQPADSPSAPPSGAVESLIAAGRFSNIDLPYGRKPFGVPTLDMFVEHSAPADRAERKLQQAEARREAKRRKLEKLRS